VAASEDRSLPGPFLLVSPAGTAVRLAAYAIAAALITEALVRGASQGWFTAVGAEGGPIEYAHYALCGAASFVFACASRRSNLRDVFALAAYGAALGVIREADAFLDKAVFQGSYKIPAALVGALALIRAYRARTVLGEQFAQWTATPSFAVTSGGVFVVLVYAQIVGQKELWQFLMGSAYLRSIKDVAEEMQELIGYFFIFFGAVESYVLTWVSRRPEIIDVKPGLN
jgi:hypothetical protein